MSYLDGNGDEERRTARLTRAMWAACVCLGLMSILSGFLSGCGSPSRIGIAVVGAIIVNIGFVTFLYTRIHATRTRLQKWTGGIVLIVALYCVASALSASVWVFYSEPQSLSAAIQEFELALRGRQCG